MRVTINLAKGSGPRELVEVLRAAEAVKPTRRSHLDPVSLLTNLVHRIVTLTFNGLEGAIHQRVCGFVTRNRHKKLQIRWEKLKARLGLVKDNFWVRWCQVFA